MPKSAWGKDRETSVGNVVVDGGLDSPSGLLLPHFSGICCDVRPQTSLGVWVTAPP